MFRGVECQGEDWMQLQFAGRGRQVAPIALNVNHVYERRRRQLLDVSLECLFTGARRQRWPTFFPRVTHQPEAVILDGLVRLRGYQNRVPACVLFDPERSLVQTIGDLRPWSKIVV